MAYREEIRWDLLKFGFNSKVEGGFGYLDNAGQVDDEQGVNLYITGRITHVFSLALLDPIFAKLSAENQQRIRALAEHGVKSLLDGPLVDKKNGGWFAQFRGAEVTDSRKEAYAHTFVILAAASAKAAGVTGAEELLQQACTVVEEKFWNAEDRLVVETWDSAWNELSDYRGMNSNMHTVEAFLAAGDATGNRIWYERAEAISLRLVEWAENNNWRIPEHYTSNWEPLLDFNMDHPADPFRPFGATVGHGLEWSRLLIFAAMHATTADNADALRTAAGEIFDRALQDGWAVDGAPGFVYTTDWNGAPVVRARMHWVVTEAIAAAASLHEVTGEPKYQELIQEFWDYVHQYLLDRDSGSWHHELDTGNAPSGETWSGKPDLYHAYQAALSQDITLAPSFAQALIELKAQQ